MLPLVIAATAFVGTHLLMSHPLRAPMVRALGQNGFMGVYALVSLGTLGWLAHVFKRVPVGVPLYDAGPLVWAISSALMLLASILLLGSIARNPALPGADAATLATRPPVGVFTWTRHPMNWSFALWALSHALVSPRPPVLILTAFIALLAIAGSLGQDAKKAALIGQPWRAYMDRTAFIPFTKGAGFPGMHALGGGLVVWLVITWLHPLAGAGQKAGIWHWLG